MVSEKNNVLPGFTFLYFLPRFTFLPTRCHFYIFFMKLQKVPAKIRGFIRHVLNTNKPKSSVLLLKIRKKYNTKTQNKIN